MPDMSAKNVSYRSVRIFIVANELDSYRESRVVMESDCFKPSTVQRAELIASATGPC